MQELNRLAAWEDDEYPGVTWYSNIGTKAERVTERLQELAPLYDQVANKLSNVIGDALEVATFQALREARAAHGRYHFDGHFFLNKPKNGHGRYEQRKAPKAIDDRTTNRQPDFLQYGHDAGVLCVECKNYREWTYPQKSYIKHHILRCDELDVLPVFVVRRIHYTTLTNFFEPAGIIAHESLYQYFPSDQAEIAAKAKHRDSLGFTDILASETPHARTVKFFSYDLPKVVEFMAERWKANRTALVEYANDEINLAQLYNAIGSRAGGKWVEPEAEPAPDPDGWQN